MILIPKLLRMFMNEDTGYSNTRLSKIVLYAWFSKAERFFTAFTQYQSTANHHSDNSRLPWSN